MLENQWWNNLEGRELTICERAVEMMMLDIEEIHHIDINKEKRMSDIKRYIKMLSEEAL